MIEDKPIRKTVSAALTVIEESGTLVGSEFDTRERLTLLREMRREGLIIWDEEAAKYNLTDTGREWLRVYGR